MPIRRNPASDGPSNRREDPPFVERDERDPEALRARVHDKTAEPDRDPAHVDTTGETRIQAGAASPRAGERDRSAGTLPVQETSPAGSPAVRIKSPASSSPPSSADSPASKVATKRLLAQDTTDDLQKRMHNAVSSFVDNPTDAVAEAESVTQQISKLLVDALEQRRHELEQARRDTGGDTEQLRQALLRHRDHINGLLSM
jgi:hypothetical protein